MRYFNAKLYLGKISHYHNYVETLQKDVEINYNLEIKATYWWLKGVLLKPFLVPIRNDVILAYY